MQLQPYTIVVYVKQLLTDQLLQRVNVTGESVRIHLFQCSAAEEY